MAYEVFDYHALPGGPHDGVGVERIQGFDAQQGMQQPAIAQVNLRRLDQALAQVGVVRRQHSQHEGVRQDIQVAPHSRRGQSKAGGNLAGVPELAVQVGEHEPEAAQLAGGYGNAQLRQILFQKSPDEGVAPAQAGLVAGGEKTLRKTAAQQEFLLVLRCRTDFIQREGGELQIFDASGQRLRRLPPQCRGCRTEQQKTSGWRDTFRHPAAAPDRPAVRDQETPPRSAQSPAPAWSCPPDAGQARLRRGTEPVIHAAWG